MNGIMDCKVSVSIITYNHEDYIAQAIDSALEQRTNFDYAILIGEDDSCDRTRTIVECYKEKYPDKIRLFLNDRKDVIYIDGKPTGRWNLVNNLRHARGQYVAWLDGDDHWTSPHKLQRQVDYLDSHPDCAVCFHAVARRHEDENREISPAGGSLRKEIYTIEDLFEGNFVASCSVMFRNGLFGEFPDWYYTVPVGDWPLHILNAQHGTIGYIDEVMGVHRIHGAGIRSSRSAVDRLRSSIDLLETVKQHLGREYRQQLDDSIARWYLRLVVALLRIRDYSGARLCIVDLLSNKQIPARSLGLGVVWMFGHGPGVLNQRLALNRSERAPR